MDRKLVILDLDETLVHSKSTQDAADSDPPDFRNNRYITWKRPYLDAFLSFVIDHFDVAVWSSGGEDYVQYVCNFLFYKQGVIPKFVWSSRKCTQVIPDTTNWASGYFGSGGHYLPIKDLKKVCRTFKQPLESMLLIDDTPFKAQRQYGNYIRVSEWFPYNKDDDELLVIQKLLMDLKEVENVRTIEKRNWYSKYGKYSTIN